MSNLTHDATTMLKSISLKIGATLVHYGVWGLFAMSFLDSSLVPLPVINDVALIAMASNRPALWPIYAATSTLGSVAGAFLMYWIARAGGEFFFRRATPRSIQRAQRWLGRNEFVSMLIASILPPPAPLKVFVLTAGVLRVSPVNFVAAMLVGRGLRFTADSWLGAHFGVQAEEYLRHNLVWVSLVVVGGIVGLVLVQRWIGARNSNA